jgi:hypothetical protein
VHEPRQLVARKECLLQRRVARQLEVLGVREDRVDQLLGVALLPEDRSAVLGMLVERRVHLVVEIVEEGGGAPELLVFAETARVTGHRSFDGERVPPQRFALRVLRESLPGPVPRYVHRRRYDSPLLAESRPRP